MSTETVSDVTSGSRLQQYGLITLMVVGSFAMWAGAPALVLWLAGRNSAVAQTAMGSLVVILIGIPTLMFLIGKLLVRVDDRYTAKFGRGEGLNQRAAWLHGVRGDGEDATMLDKIMVVSVGIALTLVGVWFIFFSGGSAAPAA